MAILIEFEITRLNAALPVADADILFADGSAILKVLSGTNNLQLSDGTNTTVFTDALTQSVTSTVKVFTTAHTMQLSVDDVDLSPVYFSGFAGELEILTDSDDFTVRNLSIYDTQAESSDATLSNVVGDSDTGQVSHGLPLYPRNVVALNSTNSVGFSPFPVLSTVPSITSVSDCKLKSTITIETAEPYNNLQSVTLYGRELTNVSEVDSTTITADLGAGGYGPVNETAQLVVTDAVGSSLNYPVTLLVPDGHIVTKLTQAAAFFPGTEAGDEILQISPVTHNNTIYNPHVNPDGSIDFDGTEHSIQLTLWLNDASDGYQDGYEASIYSPDLVKPVITLSGGTASVVEGGTFTPPTVLIQDNKDGDISGSVAITGSVDVNTVGNYQFQYNAVDAAGNVADEVVFDVEVTAIPDTTIPVITVTGGTTSMIQGGVYTPPAVTASDDTDGDITVDVVQTGTIDVNTAGTQTVYFDVQDAAGNDAVQASHTVVITALNSTPTQFNFVDQVDVALNTLTTSAAITVLGINTDSPISIVDGEYSINGGAYTASAGTVSVDDAVTVRVTSSGSNSTAVNVVLTIGGVSDTFTVTTLASVPSDSIPAQFTLGADVTGAALNAVTVRSFTIADIDTDTTFNATDDAEVSADGSTNWGSSFTVSAPSTGYMRLAASGSNSTAVTGGVESGGISDSMTVTTAAIQTDDIYSSNLVIIESKNRTGVAVNDGDEIPSLPGRWDPSEIEWLDFQSPENKSVQSVSYSLPSGWTSEGTRENVTVTSSAGVEYPRTYSVKLSTTHTRRHHIISAVFTYNDSTIDSRSVRVAVGNT